jgi:hypothetical protein
LILILIAAAIVAAAVAWSGRAVARELVEIRRDRVMTRRLDLLAAFTPAIAAAAGDPRTLLVWHPLARAARQMFQSEFAGIDEAFGRTFPFGRDEVQAAHARWTADWLAWEKSHDAEYKLKAAVIERELHESVATDLHRARLDAVEREKLELYQRRYEEYVRVAKAIQSLSS